MWYIHDPKMFGWSKNSWFSNKSFQTNLDISIAIFLLCSFSKIPNIPNLIFVLLFVVNYCIRYNQVDYRSYSNKGELSNCFSIKTNYLNKNIILNWNLGETRGLLMFGIWKLIPFVTRQWVARPVRRQDLQ